MQVAPGCVRLLPQASMYKVVRVVVQDIWMFLELLDISHRAYSYILPILVFYD